MQNNYQPPMQQMPYYPQMQPEPKKKKSVGLIIAIIAVSLAIVAASLFGALFVRKLKNDKQCEAAIRAIETDHVEYAVTLCRDGNKAFVRDCYPLIADALTRQVRLHPYLMPKDSGFVNEEAVELYLDYRDLAQVIELQAYAPQIVDYINIVCELEDYVAYDEILQLTYETNGDLIEGLNHSTDGFDYMKAEYYFLGASYLDDAVEYFDRALDDMEDYDMDAIYVREYYEANCGLRDSLVNIAKYARERDFSKLMVELEVYGGHLEDANAITQSVHPITTEMLDITERMEDAEDRL